MGNRLTDFVTSWPKLVTLLMVSAAVVLATLAALPSIWPQTFPMLSPVRVDTDPENMLSEDEAVRVFHDRMKALDISQVFRQAEYLRAQFLARLLAGFLGPCH